MIRKDQIILALVWGGGTKGKNSKSLPRLSIVFLKFQLSISCGTQKSAKIPHPVAKMIWSFLDFQDALILYYSNLDPLLFGLESDPMLLN